MKNIIRLITGVMLVTLVLSFSSNTVMAAEQIPEDQYTKVLLDNDKVRVTEINRPPGTVTPMHTHLPYVAYIFSPFKMKNTFSDGTVKVAEPKAGGVAKWKPKGATHSHEVMGTENAHLLLIEIKQ